MIELQNLTRQFNELYAVKNVNLTINEGELIAFIGPSGCGKSTTLRMLNRLIEPSEGKVVINGIDSSQIPLTELRRQMGYVIQSTGLFPHWNVAKNIATVPRLLKWSENKIQHRIDELMTLLDLTPIHEFKDKYPHELSGGQAQRVGIARALAAEPKILLMDEPFGALDPITRASLQQEILKIHRQGKTTIIFVTHDMDEALAMADKIVLMKDGELVQYARPLDVLINPKNEFVQEFLGQSDLGLKLLSKRQVKQYIQEASLDTNSEQYHWLLNEDNSPKSLIGGKVITIEGSTETSVTPEWLATPDMSMKEALSRMIWYRVSVLPVVDESRQLIGELSLDSMMCPPSKERFFEQ